MAPPISARSPLVAERRFYTGMALLMLAAMFLGFSRTYFLNPWFPEVAHMLPPESFFFSVHGVSVTAWFLLLVVQSALVANGRLARHRSLGWFGAGLAAVVVVAGTIGALIAARRPGGFIGVPVPPLQFLVVPLAILALFALFITLAIVWRRDRQGHKRLMLLATIALLDAAVVRWPFADMSAPIVTLFTRTDLAVDLFLVPMIIWDLASRGRVHPVTLIGGLAIVASQPLRLLLAETTLWMNFARWAVSLLGT
jgi:hypothetical protein